MRRRQCAGDPRFVSAITAGAMLSWRKVLCGGGQKGVLPMRHRIVLAAVSAALLITFGYARQNSDQKVVIQGERTSPTDGKQMYKNYCAPCHGLDAKGNGPVASSLRQQPADLTVLTRNNQGKFPESRVAAVLSFGSEHPAHGTATMPVWGPILGRMDRVNVNLGSMRILNLCNYLRTLQEK